jgi:hypothetical protein
MAVSKLKVVTNGSSIADRWSLFFNGEDISKYVRGIQINACVGSPVSANLYLAAVDVEMPDEFTADITVVKDGENGEG